MVEKFMKAKYKTLGETTTLPMFSVTGMYMYIVYVLVHNNNTK